MTEGGVGNGERGEAAPPRAPFDLWTQWLRTNMGDVTAPPGVSVPWLATPGVPAGEAAEALPEGAIRNDPLLQAMEQLWDAHPLRNVLPISWAEITRALQTLWLRELSDPARATQRAAEYNRRLFETTMEVWGDATARFWGLPREEKEEEGRPDKRFSEPEWENNPFYQTLKESYLLASEYLLNEA
ncbi:MAG: hypothetical protein M3341_06510, partial [Actinomycetota bacterium]|nr:hypothetical protein [Actinomycetota bacterium]